MLLTAIFTLTVLSIDLDIFASLLSSLMTKWVMDCHQRTNVVLFSGSPVMEEIPTSKSNLTMQKTNV